MKVNEDDKIGPEIAFQVVDKVNKALLSVNRVCAQGHDVVFSEKKGHFILLNGSTDVVIALRTVGGTYDNYVWIRPGEGGGPSLGGVEHGISFPRHLFPTAISPPRPSLGGVEAPFARPVHAR